MSSTITRSEMETVHKRKPSTITKPHQKPKPDLVRSTSMEKIRRFNTYICSQNYYIFPSILAWLKTSQSVLQSTTEKTLFFFKTLLVTSVFYRTVEAKARRQLKSNLDALTGLIKLVFYALFTGLKVVYDSLKNILFKSAVYSSIVLIYGQLLLCAYWLCQYFMPIGLAFLLVCLYSIVHLLHKVNFAYVQRQEKKMREKKSERQSRPRSKNILGDRTISNFNLF